MSISFRLSLQGLPGLKKQGSIDHRQDSNFSLGETRGKNPSAMPGHVNSVNLGYISSRGLGYQLSPARIMVPISARLLVDLGNLRAP
jgi:hypothetical protein